MWQPKIILQNDKLLPYEQASVHPMTLGMTYATAVFEGFVRTAIQKQVSSRFLDSRNTLSAYYLA